MGVAAYRNLEQERQEWRECGAMRPLRFSTCCTIMIAGCVAAFATNACSNPNLRRLSAAAPTLVSDSEDHLMVLDAIFTVPYIYNSLFGGRDDTRRMLVVAPGIAAGEVAHGHVAVR